MPSRFSPKTISLSFGILVLLFSLVFIAFAWTEPTLLPPSGNADAPLNVGTTAQTKNARLSVTELYDANDSTYYLNPNGQSVLSGPLGIGTTGPATPLHVSGASITGGDSRFNLRLDDTAAFAAGVGAGIQFVGKIDATGTLNGFASIKGIKENGTSGNPSGALSLITSSNTGANVERMRIDSAGNVGIGITPIEKLTIAASNAELLSLRNIATAAVTNMAYIYFGMKDSAANDDYFGAISGKSTGITNGSENGALAFSVKNAGAWNQVLYIQNDGSIGIGNSSPTTALDLNGALSIRAIAAPSVSPASQGRIYFDSTANKFKVSENGGTYIDLLSASGLTGSGSSGQAAFFTGASALSGDNGFFWDNTNKRLGIGTTTPDFPLHIVNNNNLYVEFQNTTPGGYEELYLRGDNGNSQIFHVNSTYAGWGGANSLNLYNSNGPIAFYANSLNSSLFLNAGTGNVGIGTTSPGMKLDILPGTGTETAFRIQSSGGTSDNFYIGQWGGTGSNWNLGGQNAGAMNLYINRNAGSGDVIIGATNGGANSRVLMIQGSTGNVGIGTTSPGQKLDIAGSMNFSGGWGDDLIQFGGQTFVEFDENGVGDTLIRNINAARNLKLYSFGNPNNMLVLATNGNVGIGTTTPSSKLTVAGTIESTGFKLTTSPSAGYVLTSDASGGGTWQAAAGVPSGTSITTTSPYPPSGYTYTGNFVSAGSDPGNLWTTKASMPTARNGLSAATVNNKIYAIGGQAGAWLSTNEEYDPSTNNWTSKTGMPTARDAFALAVVNDKIYAIGGRVSGGGNSSVNEEYNPATNTWATKTAMPTARSYLAAASVNNKIYAIGGWTSSAVSTNEEYDPAVGAGGTWTAKTAMPTARDALVAVAVNNKIYAIGGGVYSSANEEYDPAVGAGGTWTAKTAMPTGRTWFAAASANNKIYAIGGVSGSSNKLSNNEEYNPITNSWESKPQMPTGRYFIAAAGANDKIYVLGGWNISTSLSDNEEYNPGWTIKANMPTSRLGAGAGVINNKIYVAGGCDSSCWMSNNFYSQTEEYDPATNTWASKATMLYGRPNFAAVVVNNKLYAIGGNTSGCTGVCAVGNNEVFDPNANTWTGKAGMPTARKEMGAAAVNGKIYVMGGVSYVGGWYSRNENEEYNPATDTWAGKVAMPTYRNGHGVVALNNKIYAIGGTNWTGSQTANEEYDPIANTWISKKAMPTSQSFYAIGAVNNKIYILGSDYHRMYSPLTDTFIDLVQKMPTLRYRTTSAVLGNKIYVIGGQKASDNQPSNSNEEYTPETFYYIHTKK